MAAGLLDPTGMVHMSDKSTMTELATTGRILVTGATGYVGGRLWRLLESGGFQIRCLARNPQRLARRVGPGTEVIQGDVLDRESLNEAMRGVETAYYLVHAMGAPDQFEELDRQGAMNFAAAAQEAGVKRIIYLGGLADENEELSAHLASRHEVGRLLAAGGIATIELRASIVLGSGSLSFEMIRSLVERLPAMITPKWVAIEAQPIAINDLLQYLVQSLDLPLESRVIEVGGADRASYGDLMQEYARQRGLRRIMVPVPFLTPRLSSLWLGLVTPLYARVGKKLIASIEHPTVVQDKSARELFNIVPCNLADAIANALCSEENEFAETSWFDAVSSAGVQPSRAGVRYRNRLLDTRTLLVAAPPSAAFAPIRRIGGAHGWYAYHFLWNIRGWVDLLFGGVGIRRGRRDKENLDVGDAVDFWRVERFEPDELLQLRAEMKVPGRAWLEFKVEPDGTGSRIHQTAVYDPEGLLGLMYWYALYPIHGPVFNGMLQGIAKRALAEDAS
ncbi:MAG: hypothetical protein ACI9UK_000977 [Candidatus Krumholzibacteriia bacterium]|jgi:uncharacterized protein YbjT (DUF2867 family)